MSAAVLSPVEREHVDAVGLHDLDILSEMEERADDELPCVIKEDSANCGKPATHVLVCVQCCSQTAVACGYHAAMVAKSEHIAKHSTCGASDILRDLVRVVPL